MGTEMLDCGASRAFAVADHQTAHIYINDPSVKEEVKALLSATPGVEEIRETDFSGLSSAALERLPEFTAVAAPDAWFTYYYWMTPRRRTSPAAWTSTVNPAMTLRKCSLIRALPSPCSMPPPFC